MNNAMKKWLDQQNAQTKYWIGAILVLMGAVGFSAKAVIIKMAYQYPVDFVSLLMFKNAVLNAFLWFGSMVVGSQN